MGQAKITKFITLFTMIIAGMFWFADSADALWLSGWTYRKVITINEVKVDADLYDLPIAIILASSTNFDFTKASSTGADIRFTQSDGETLLKYERERHNNTSGYAEYWVKTNTSSTASTTFYIYYGNSGAADGADPTAVWTNFKLVSHLASISGVEPDSTVEANNGTVGGAIRGVAGKINSAFTFDATWGYEDDDYVDYGEGAGDFETANFTWEIWFKPSIIDIHYRLVMIKSGNPSLPRHHLHRRGSDQLHTGLGGEGSYWSNFVFSFATGTWTYIVWSYDGANCRLYQDGVLLATNSYTGGVPASTMNFVVSKSADYGDGSLGADGDEVRVSSVKRSDAWIKASYNSENDSLLTYGSEEGGAVAKEAVIDWSQIIEEE